MGSVLITEKQIFLYVSLFFFFFFIKKLQANLGLYLNK